VTDRRPPLHRRLLAEALGTGLLVAVVVGSGIAAQRLSPDDTGLQLLQNSLATALALPVIILLVGPVSGGHLNPAVTLVDWLLGRRTGRGLPAGEAGAYAAAQVAGGVAGAVLANVMFDLAPVTVSARDRVGAGALVAEVVATAGLVALVVGLVRSGRGALTAGAVGAWIGAAYWFTSSTSFANPAVTIARTASDTFAGIAPGSAAAFVAAQLVGALTGAVLALGLYPDAALAAGGTVIPPEPGHDTHDTQESR
jgi:glycerol uptake facilitator-like aquaporin